MGDIVEGVKITKTFYTKSCKHLLLFQKKGFTKMIKRTYTGTENYNTL